MDDIEDLSVDIYQSWCNKESARRIELFPLLLLQHLDLLLWRYLLFDILWVFVKLLCHFVAHFLLFYSNLSSLLLYQLLEVFIVISFLAEFNALARFSNDLIEFKSKLDINSDGSQVIYDNLLDINVFKSIGIVNELGLVLDSLLIRFEVLSSSAIWAWRNVIDSLRRNTSWNESTNKCDCMWGAAINGDVLWLLLSFQKLNVFGVNSKVLIKIGVIYRIDTFNIIFVFVVRRSCQSTRDKAFILK